MEALVRTLALIALIALSGCASVLQGESIPVPASTPFDRSPMTRMAYLEAYRDGYRGVMSGTVGSVEIARSPYPFARELGWRAGAAAARSALAAQGQEKTDGPGR